MQSSSQSLYRVAEIRQAERIAIEDLHMPGLQLMRSAGQAAFTILRQRWPDAHSLRVFCGAGNNAGDGYVVARLALQAGYAVEVYSAAAVENLTGDALISYQDFIDEGGKIASFNTEIKLNAVIVDALLGTGLNRQVSEEYAALIEFINRAKCPVLAIDVPSGLHADTGNVMGCAVKADVTVSFIGLKCGLFTGEAAEYCGDILCSNLQVPESVFLKLAVAANLFSKAALAARPRNAHKGNFGHVLLVGGNLGFSGAIRLAGEAALRSGAGLVSIASRVEHVGFLNMGRPELMCHGVESVAQLTALLHKASVIVIGPGLGQDAWGQMLWSAVLASDKTCVVDADALNLLAKQPVFRENWILTPHPGEAARLLGASSREIAADRFAAVKNLQMQYGGVSLLKGAGSLIADQQAVFVSATGNPGMASGGMGDVLAGMIGGLVAQGLSLIEATKLAVYVHGEAADCAAAENGERGLLASDLLPKIRELLN
ncbi:bifunctional ADP-dependent (S)-NAD(P)H-hydrate dehydratase/NAD(P)H-hydrate epimerase [Methylomonas lenta]|uniref:Bifunctional NAD(P)H-hydrate repair enzyme n=1 Tax=Methylomonas lenta TaxID=980561 RepID=A0A177NDI1_9GAMM|nr:bifunctional ADP-dependent NAD(P)H-hydrate dehydratase/NAD(P)H-hydrate epimerase [Methylomonas lenta]OAI16118.1 bifunctional ADP-dependent (S)-NAD(P)H-hydrate dehydratase/NAD(P)H-hydrate epimerase [Methylomonas lenta]